MLDLYCERQHDGLLAEPINTLTNMAFVWAAIEAWNLAGARKCRSTGIVLMIFLAGLVGIGSAVWHMCQTPWSSSLDLIPILLFQLSFLWLYLTGIAGSGKFFASILLAAYVTVNILAGELPPWLNGSVMYLPTGVSFLLICLHYRYIAKTEDTNLIKAGLLFSLAVVFRSIDLNMEPVLPCGTHFLWHVLNGRVFFLIMKTIILNATAKPPNVSGSAPAAGCGSDEFT